MYRLIEFWIGALDSVKKCPDLSKQNNAMISYYWYVICTAIVNRIFSWSKNCVCTCTMVFCYQNLSIDGEKFEVRGWRPRIWKKFDCSSGADWPVKIGPKHLWNYFCFFSGNLATQTHLTLNWKKKPIPFSNSGSDSKILNRWKWFIRCFKIYLIFILLCQITQIRLESFQTFG